MPKQLLWVDVDAFRAAILRSPLTAEYALPILDAVCPSQGDQAGLESGTCPPVELSQDHLTPCSDSIRSV